jgi:hypothetical protein
VGSQPFTGERGGNYFPAREKENPGNKEILCTLGVKKAQNRLTSLLGSF